MQALLLLSEGGDGPNVELLWLLGILFAFFALAIIVGWVAAQRKLERARVKHEAVSIPIQKKSGEDDLTRIEGIGPKVVKVLGQAGVVTFDDLAKAGAADVQKVLDQAGLQMMSPEGWIDQAKLAAAGDWEALDKMQKILKGGRKKK
ncbi:hypothetical protein MASR2M66_27370 [Chloroflexota bacterium]